MWIFVGDERFETRALIQVVAKLVKSCLVEHDQLQFIDVHFVWRRNPTVCCCLRTVEDVPTLTSSVPLMGHCVQGAE